MNSARIGMLETGDSIAAAADNGVPTYLAQVNLYRTLLRNPALAKPIADLVVHLWRRSSLDDRSRELTIMRVAWLTGCDYEWSHHWDMAQKAGLSVDELTALRDEDAAARFTALDRAVLTATDETVGTGVVSDGTWALLVEDLPDERTVLEFLATISTWRTVSELVRSLGVPLEDGFVSWPPDGVGPQR